MVCMCGMYAYTLHIWYKKGLGIMTYSMGDYFQAVKLKLYHIVKLVY